MERAPGICLLLRLMRGQQFDKMAQVPRAAPGRNVGADFLIKNREPEGVLLATDDIAEGGGESAGVLVF